MSSEARVLAYGMACPVGLRTGPALAAMYAGINRFEESDDVRDAAGDPARRAALRRLDPKTPRTERASFFARHALTEVSASLGSAGLASVPCFLALPEPGLGAAFDVASVQRALAVAVREAGGAFTLELRPDRLFARGRAGAFVALHAALDALGRGACSVALVGGLDARVDPITLRALADANRLLGRRNPDGLLPGEGAAFVLLASIRAASAHQALARLSSCALAREPHPRGHGGPDVAPGLTAVLRELRLQRPGRVDTVISAQTGEGGYGRSFSYAYLRNATLMPEPLRLVTLGALLGDAGAAAGAMALVAAIAGLQPGVVPGTPPRHGSALVFGESDDGTVGGCIVEAASTGRRA
jgi:3-oxoacyl-[acyl-carrier-protein] synthase I